MPGIEVTTSLGFFSLGDDLIPCCIGISLSGIVFDKTFDRMHPELRSFTKIGCSSFGIILCMLVPRGSHVLQQQW